MDIKDIMGKKKAEKDPAKKDAKMEALKAMRSTASDMMKGGMQDKMQKVTVAAKDPKDLEAGLDKAKELVGKNMPMDPLGPKIGDNIQDPHEGPEEDEASEHDEMVDMCDDPEELDAMMEKIAEKKRQLMMKKA